MLHCVAFLIHMSVCFICQCVSYVSVFHMSVCFICQCVSYVSVFHMSMCFIVRHVPFKCQSVSLCDMNGTCQCVSLSKRHVPFIRQCVSLCDISHSYASGFHTSVCFIVRHFSFMCQMCFICQCHCAAFLIHMSV